MIKILVEPSDYTFFNIGDTAMLQVAVRRLKVLFPDSSVRVFTDDPEGLKYYCPDAMPLWIPERSARYSLAPVYEFLERDGLTKYSCRFVRTFRQRVPLLARHVMARILSQSTSLSKERQHYLRAVAEADLVVVSGMGGLTDSFLTYAHGLLDTLGLAIYLGVPTAMFGQGMGPIKDPQLVSHTSEILPYVTLFSLREGRAGPPLLRSLGVPAERVLVTGDDAIEAAYRWRPKDLGDGLGLNLRAADYSQVDQIHIENIRPVIQNFATSRNAPIVPIPISRVSGEEDMVTIRQLVTGYQHVIGIDGEFDTQEEVLRQVLRCRVVVTGSYHAAVFALGMGIPAVGLAKSEYYVDKFLGLAELFTRGCQVVLLDDPQMRARLQAAIETLWESADSVRPELLTAAEHQIELGHAAYQRLWKIAGRKARKKIRIFA
jgi:colanic acid/amylovoran biosynthesis protein